MILINKIVITIAIPFLIFGIASTMKQIIKNAQ